MAALGIDTLVGGLGNDTYVVDNAADIVTEAASAGTDAVQASVSYVLAANVENLTLTGSAALNGTGNTLANVLTGNAGDNRLDGGAGIDTLAGGLGNDTYVVDNAADVTTEARDCRHRYRPDGARLGRSRANVENLLLTGSGAVNGTGNTLANVLTGNGAANRLDGGAGADSMAAGSATTPTSSTTPAMSPPRSPPAAPMRSKARSPGRWPRRSRS